MQGDTSGDIEATARTHIRVSQHVIYRSFGSETILHNLKHRSKSRPQHARWSVLVIGLAPGEEFGPTLGSSLPVIGLAG
jgi:hypothetical protein